MTFNVILVRGTVRLLRVFLHSLQTRTTGTRFRLVANGCSPHEVSVLRGLCEGDDRFELLELSRSSVMSHPVVLDELIRRERSPIFAFMDSDCFVTGDPFKSMDSALENNDAVFSGLPRWRRHRSMALPNGHKTLSDAYLETAEGRCAGNSYFAVYDAPILSACMKDRNLSFREYRWDALPAPVKSELIRADLRLDWFDTGKLLNIVLGLRGHSCVYVDLPHLWHVGGVSASVSSRNRRRLHRLLAAAGIRGPLRRILVRLGVRPQERLGEDEQRSILEYAAHRDSVSVYVSALLRSLERGTRLPKFESSDASVVSAVELIEMHVRALHQGWQSSQRGAPSL